ncbi:MAG: hypothetical protein HYU36_22165 [Planctomycetes bacterium]|nr:hypothetical protein [Planctomycetota bacterium]
MKRIPGGGIQPQVRVDAQGQVHLIAFHGEPMNGDIDYFRSSDGGDSFSKPLRVNSHPGSAIAVGNIRGAQMALGKGGRVHVAWNGSGEAEPRGPSGQTPMLYARLNDAGKAFEPEKNVMQFAHGLDGGGSVAADAAGNVYVVWHAGVGAKGENKRRVFIARSRDEGKTFDREKPAWDAATGACGCCGLSAFADPSGNVSILYRSAQASESGAIDNRDMYLLVSTNQGAKFQGKKVGSWQVNQCVMSLSHFTENAKGALAAWESREQVYFAEIDSAGFQVSSPVPAPGLAARRKHPVVARNAAGETCLAWTEGMGWQKGGAVAWQVFDAQGKPTGEKGRADGVPAWSLVAVFARPRGGFTVVY